MAPSPTGDYHIGHIRTLLYNWAFAKKSEGKFIIRIEDTDRERFVEGAPDRILDVIKDYGLDWDEGPRVGGPFGPYVQSERLDIYKKYALELVEKGQAYYCFCSLERLAEVRKKQQEQGLPVTKYDRHCLGLTKEEIDQNLKAQIPYVIRLRVPDNETITFNDAVYGEVSINSSSLDDQVLLKSDGFPTYHLGVVVDDHLMEITHVMRGNDWLPSTPKHVLLYKAFGWELPVYIHLPNLKERGENKKLSKRFGSVFAVEFLKEGYLPEAVLNFLMFLGWNPGTEKEIYTLDEFVKDFSVEKIHKTDLVSFDREKLAWLNGHYIRSLSIKDLWDRLEAWAQKFEVSLDVGDFSPKRALKVLGLVQERMKVLGEFSKLTYYFFHEPEVDKNLLVKQAKSEERSKEILEKFIALYESVDTWGADHLEKVSHELVKKEGWKVREAFMTLRVAVSGSTATPPLFAVLEVLGKDEVLKRLRSIHL